MLPREVEHAATELAGLSVESLGRAAAMRRVKNIVEVLRQFRNFIVHSGQDERPAYVLDGGEF